MVISLRRDIQNVRASAYPGIHQWSLRFRLYNFKAAWLYPNLNLYKNLTEMIQSFSLLEMSRTHYKAEEKI